MSPFDFLEFFGIVEEGRGERDLFISSSILNRRKGMNDSVNGTIVGYHCTDSACAVSLIVMEMFRSLLYFITLAFICKAARIISSSMTVYHVTMGSSLSPPSLLALILPFFTPRCYTLQVGDCYRYWRTVTVLNSNKEKESWLMNNKGIIPRIGISVLMCNAFSLSMLLACVWLGPGSILYNIMLFISMGFLISSLALTCLFWIKQVEVYS
jgi:hypothetical protein